MKTSHARSRRRVLALLTTLCVTAAACGSDSKKSSDAAPATDKPAATEAAGGTTVAGSAATDSSKPVTITWWHIQNTEPMMSLWQQMADEFEKAHPNVKINITVMENEAFKATLQTKLQAGDVPDLFQSWGGGGLREQVKAGLVRDITSDASGFIGNLNPGAVGLYQVDGKQYGIPFNLGMVGFWYNKDLFAKAGIKAPPATWEEFLTDVKSLQDAGVTPIAVGAGDKWPAHFYYAYLMLRLGGSAAMSQVTKDLNFNAPTFVKAGEELKRLIDLKPFQPGFLATPWDGADGEAGFMGSGQTAMDLMGQWAPGSFRTSSPDGNGIDAKLGWFPFPSVAGGAGAATDAFGGGDGFAVGKNAPPEAVQFLEYITSVEQASRAGKTGTVLPVTTGADASVTDPNQLLVLHGISQAKFVQLYLDQYFTPALGAAVNDAVQTLFAGTASATDVADAITKAAATG